MGKARITSLNYVLWRLKARINGFEPKNHVSGTDLTIGLNENLGLKDPIEIRTIDQVNVMSGGILV